MKSNEQLAEQLLDTKKSERPKRTRSQNTEEANRRREKQGGEAAQGHPKRPREVVPNPHSSLPLAQVSGRLRGDCEWR